MVDKPKLIKVGPYVYTVFFDKKKIKKASYGQGKAVYGETDKNKLEIIVDPEPNIQIQREILWHEIKHAAYAWVEAAIDDPTEEQIICLTAPIELQIMRDNPELLEFLTGV